MHLVNITGDGISRCPSLRMIFCLPSDWHHGYEVARETGLKSGTLSPILTG
jgi:hypothetical protein